ncbi:MAG: Hpt domain-containing protein [Stagnimonas sp.]|nr:Hpt domain-containing protein [Stagnimonas sp.]
MLATDEGTAMTPRPSPNAALGQRLVLANSLKWLAPEIDASLQRARALIDQHQEADDGELDADAVQAELKLVLGALRMASCHGGALLAEELCAAIEVVSRGQLSQSAEALAAVSGATLQLSDYLDALRHAAPDRAAVLQPAISELRLACGSTAATEADLFVKQMLRIHPQMPVQQHMDVAASASVVAGKLLSAFQILLLQWLKGIDVPNTLLKLRKVGDHIASHATRPDILLLWSAFAAAIDSLVSVPGSESLELKRWVGRLGQQIKILAERGEDAADPQSLEIAWRLLAYAAPIHHGGNRWLLLRHHLLLDATLPIEPALSAARQQLRGPNTRLLEKVADEVRADLALVKDGLDLALRSGGLSPDLQGSLGERLGRIANTLVLLGLPQLEQVLRNQTGELASLGSGAAENQGQWMRIATALLRVEHSLERALFRPLRQIRVEPLTTEIIEAVPHSQDLLESIAALLREMLVDLAKLKAQLDAYLKGGELRDAAEPLLLLSEVSSGLVILDCLPAANLTAELRDWLRAAGPQELRDDPALAVRFAESVAALELYLEALRDALPQPERMLETLSVALAALAPAGPDEDAISLDALTAEMARAVANADSASDQAGLSSEYAVENLEAAPEAQVFFTDTPRQDAGSDPASEAAYESAAAMQAPFVTDAEPSTALAAGDDDPEIRAIFIEEVQEVLDSLKRQLPLFHRDPTDLAVLGDIRRAFHTLKGSGRMVGADRIGEFGWSVEHLLNRCIEGALPVNHAVVMLVGEAIRALPMLLSQFREDAPEQTADDAQTLIARAHFLASGRAPEMVEPEVLGVFRTDAFDRLGDIERWLANEAESFIDADTVRALHTIKGSAAVVNAEALSELSGALEAVLKQFVLADVPVSPEVRAVLAEVLPVMRDWMLKAGSAASVQDDAEWLARVAALKPFLPPTGETLSYGRRESLVNLAFDRLQMVEQRLVAWTVAPADFALGRLMGDAAEALAIVSQECAPLTRGAEALSERLRADDLLAGTPDSTFFIALTNALEHLYQFLDGYREGGIRDSGRELAELLRRLPLRSEPPPSATAPWQSDAVMQESTDQSVDFTFSEEPVPFTADASGDGFMPTTDWAAAEQPLPLELHVIPHGVPGPPEMVDTELAEVFVEEARELLAVLHADVPAWQPPQAPATSIMHALHTLTGSARMAGYAALGDVAQGFELRFNGLDLAAETAALLRAELLATLPVFDEAVDAFALMIPPAAETVSLFAETSDAVPPAFEETSNDWTFSSNIPVLPVVPLETPPPVFTDPYVQAQTDDAAAWLLNDGLVDQRSAPATEMPSAPQPILHPLPSLMDGMEQFWPKPEDTLSASEKLASVPPVESSNALVASAEPLREAIDPELASIFIAEAGENLETIETALADWQRDAGDATAIGELLRALHTLKGGARMTGFMPMGDVTHHMESRLSALLASGIAPVAEDHAVLKADLAVLEHMHDALSRGHYAEIARIAEPVLPKAQAPAVSAEDTSAPLRPAVAPTASGPVAEGWEPTLFWKPEEDATAATRRELARVPVESLDAMLNEAGEISIYRSRLEQQNAVLMTQLTEMRQTVVRLREQLRLMDIETDAQIAARGLNAQGVGGEADRYEQDFDPLEMDRYSRMQELSRALTEAVGDLSSLHLTMDQGVNEAQALLLQQGRINTAVQQGLMGTLMVPFSRQVARLQRVVRQSAQEEGKFADVSFEGVESELDRNVLERMTAPLEHLLRNAVVHGLENPEGRSSAGKSPTGSVTVSLKREGTQLLMEVADDGYGLNFGAIRSKAIERGLLPPDAALGDDEIARFIFEAGFSTAETLTQSAGRGVGMDVVASEVKQLGGSLELRSEAGRGTRFSIRLPLSLALSQALMVKVGGEVYALPLVAIEGIGRVPRDVAVVAVGGGESSFNYGGHDYRVRPLAELIDLPHALPDDARSVPAVLVRMGEGIAGGERRAALIVDQLLGNREVVSKAVGPQLSSISGVSGATILPSGEVVLILDPAALVIDRARRRLIAEAAANRATLEREATQSGRLIMVVDDSVTMRRVAERLLQRNGYRVLTAKDGLDAIALLQNEAPAAILLDIEMPRADGFEVAGFVRNNERISETPIIMITSRSGDKHRTRAATLGVNRYLIKPYQEEQLLYELRALLQAREAEAA